MGDSDKLPDLGPDRYTLAEHYRYFDAALGVAGNVTFATRVGVRLPLGEPAP